MKRRKDKVNLHSNNKNKKVFIIGLVIAAIAISGILAIVLPSVGIHNVNNNNDQVAKALLIKEISNPTYPLAPALGSSKAKVTMVEFGDYQCPTCGAWFSTQEASLVQNLVNTGKAKLVWRDFDFYGLDSVSASEAAYAAGEQGKFWQFHDLLFQNQQIPNGGWASRQNLVKLATQLGLNMTQFNSDFNSGKYDSLISANHALGVQAGVTETPTFFLIGSNGKMITIAGGQPESVFEQAVAQLTG